MNLRSISRDALVLARVRPGRPGGLEPHVCDVARQADLIRLGVVGLVAGGIALFAQGRVQAFKLRIDDQGEHGKVWEMGVVRDGVGR
jgi:hypothetical protein